MAPDIEEFILMCKKLKTSYYHFYSVHLIRAIYYMHCDKCLCLHLSFKEDVCFHLLLSSLHGRGGNPKPGSFSEKSEQLQKYL